MSTNITKLKRGKGAPPPADDAPDVIADDTRSEKVELRPLQVRIPKPLSRSFRRGGRESVSVMGRKAALPQDVGSDTKAQNMLA